MQALFLKKYALHTQIHSDYYSIKMLVITCVFLDIFVQWNFNLWGTRLIGKRLKVKLF